MRKVPFTIGAAVFAAVATLLSIGLAISGCKHIEPSAQTSAQRRYVRRIDAPRAFAEQAVFKIKVYDPSRPNSGGTGFLLELNNGEAVIITNRHVCENPAPNAEFLFIEQGPMQTMVGKVKAKSSETDLCIVTPPAELLSTRRGYRLSAAKLTPGEHVRVFGYPHLLPLTLYDGHYVNESEEPIAMTTFAFDPSHILLIGRLDFQIFPGNSGSPLLDNDGLVAGVIFAYENGEKPAGLFVPASSLKTFLNEQGLQ